MMQILTKLSLQEALEWAMKGYNVAFTKPNGYNVWFSVIDGEFVNVSADVPTTRAPETSEVRLADLRHADLILEKKWEVPISRMSFSAACNFARTTGCEMYRTSQSQSFGGVRLSVSATGDITLHRLSTTGHTITAITVDDVSAEDWLPIHMNDGWPDNRVRIPSETDHEADNRMIGPNLLNPRF